MLQGLGIGERLGIMHRPSVDDIAHGKLGYLAGLGTRNIGDLKNSRRNVAR